MAETKVTEIDQSFIRSSGELTAVQRRLKKLSIEMIDFLLDQVKNDKVDIKLRLQYAEKLLGYHVEVSKLVNQDNLARLVAEIKILNRVPLGGKANTAEDDTPVLNFNEIREV